ncbi:hypothetical protein GOBAR_DD01181 [Gossypium barbadense]|nr:hypothetical protein GOBAR_DD01181 [Gossypium barbadense]
MAITASFRKSLNSHSRNKVCRKSVKKAGKNEHHLWKTRDSAGSGQKALNIVRIKYRLYLGLNDIVALGNKDSCYLRMGGMFGRLNSSTALSLHGISSSVIQPGHSQTSNNLINGSRKIQPAMVLANQNQNGTLFQGVPTSIDLNQPSQNKPTNDYGEFNRVNDPNF